MVMLWTCWSMSSTLFSKWSNTSSDSRCALRRASADARSFVRSSVSPLVRFRVRFTTLSQTFQNNHGFVTYVYLTDLPEKAEQQTRQGMGLTVTSARILASLLR